MVSSDGHGGARGNSRQNDISWALVPFRLCRQHGFTGDSYRIAGQLRGAYARHRQAGPARRRRMPWTVTRRQRRVHPMRAQPTILPCLNATIRPIFRPQSCRSTVISMRGNRQLPPEPDLAAKNAPHWRKNWHVRPALVRTGPQPRPGLNQSTGTLPRDRGLPSTAQAPSIRLSQAAKICGYIENFDIVYTISNQCRIAPLKFPCDLARTANLQFQFQEVCHGKRNQMGQDQKIRRTDR